MDEWRYYNHAMIPACAPHEVQDLTEIQNGKIFKQTKSKPLFARWTDDFDCGYETEWWYVIKNEPFDIDSVKAKKRYVINKGNKHFYVKEIAPGDYVDALYSVQVDAFGAYPKKYRPTAKRQEFEGLGQLFLRDKTYKMFGAFLKETDELCGYAYTREQGICIHLPVLKTKPQYEKLEVNAALVFGILDLLSEKLKSGFYICDGARSINHETAFQDYLEKYFGFRKAYCNLNIKYNPKIGWIVKIMYPFRKVFTKFDGISIVHMLNGVFKMEEIKRKCRKSGANQ